MPSATMHFIKVPSSNCILSLMTFTHPSESEEGSHIVLLSLHGKEAQKLREAKRQMFHKTEV